MEIVLCAVQPHLAAAWRERIGADLSNCVRVVEGDILSLDVLAVVSPANSYGFMDGGLDALYTRCFGPQLQQRLQRMIREQANGELTSALNRLMVIVENYPDLKANENFIGLQDELAGTENRITVARQDYNKAVQEYNVKIRRFPSNIIAGMFGFEKAALFESSEGASSVPNVSF